MKSSSASPTYRHAADIRELRKEFVLADLDRNGRMDLAEFKRLLYSLESGMSEAEMWIGFKELDTNRDGLIDCQEFIDWLSGD